MQANKQQQRAIAHNTGPALILAGPGSGKTFTTVERVRYLIEVHHADPSHILVITFTKAAARQMRDRFFARMDNQFFPVTFGTFHAVFFHILKTSCHYNGSSILKEKEKREYLRAALLTLPKKFYAQNDGKMDQEWEQGLLSEIGFIKNIGKLPADFTSEYVSRQEFMRIFVSFQKQLAQEKKLDLDDFAAAVCHLFRTNPAELARWQREYSYLLVDEFQDINAAQYEAVKLLCGGKRNLFVVGDDDQAIYGFRGSDPAIMRQFLKDFPEAKQIVCDLFPAAIEKIGIRESDYVAVITRGHRYDADCLRELLRGIMPRYLGMIGSKRRTVGLLNMLEEEGFSRADLDRIHTPIGLDIGALTVKEIAISIVAELIAERRRTTDRRSKSSILTAEDIDLPLLETAARGDIPKTLMLVYETSGSTPVKSGSYMVVDANTATAGTIGGGCSESAVMRQAYYLIGTGEHKCVTIDMSNDTAAQEGMVCGGCCWRIWVRKKST